MLQGSAINLRRIALFVLISMSVSYEVQLFSKGNIKGRLFWNIDKTTNSLVFTFQLSKKIFTHRNVYGFVMSNDSSHKNADVLIIQVDRSGINLKDMWTDDNGHLHEDQHFDFHLTGFNVRGDEYEVSVNRSENTCRQHDYTIDSGTTNILSIFPELETTNSDCAGTYRRYSIDDSKSSHIRVQLLKANSFKVNKTGLLSFDVIAPNTVIPSASTTYYCTVHSLPTHPGKIHGVGFEGIISEKSKGLVHHMEVFLCDPADLVVPDFKGDCADKSKPKSLDRCRHVIAAWAFGAQEFFYPKEAGLALGEENMSKYVRLEIHYNNPDLLPGIRDQSGVRFYFTTSMRQYDIGIMEIGTTYTPMMAIPPGQTAFPWPGLCPSVCTKKALPSGGIRIFGSELHAHLTGTKIWTSLYREGKEMIEVSRDNHYSTWFEEIRNIVPNIDVLPGDSLITTCLFDTRDRKNVTLGGLGLHEEMCVNYLYYYPASQLEVCKSSVAVAAQEAFRILNIPRKRGNNSKISLQLGVSAYEGLKWNMRSVRNLELLYRDGPVSLHCLQPNGTSWLKHPGFVRKQKITSKHFERKDCR